MNIDREVYVLEALKASLESYLNDSDLQGMCVIIEWKMCLLSEDKKLLLRILRTFKPNGTPEFGYWFEPGYKEPRIQWCNEVISLLNGTMNLVDETINILKE